MKKKKIHYIFSRITFLLFWFFVYIIINCIKLVINIIINIIPINQNDEIQRITLYLVFLKIKIYNTKEIKK